MLPLIRDKGVGGRCEQVCACSVLIQPERQPPRACRDHGHNNACANAAFHNRAPRRPSPGMPEPEGRKALRPSRNADRGATIVCSPIEERPA